MFKKFKLVALLIAVWIVIFLMFLRFIEYKADIYSQIYQREIQLWENLRRINEERKIEMYMLSRIDYNKALMENKDLILRVIEILEGEGLDYEHILRALQIAWLESRFNPEATNINRNGTKDIGFWQINDVHGLSEEQRKDIEFSTRWAAPRLKEKPYIWAVYRSK